MKSFLLDTKVLRTILRDIARGRPFVLARVGLIAGAGIGCACPSVHREVVTVPGSLIVDATAGSDAGLSDDCMRICIARANVTSNDSLASCRDVDGQIECTIDRWGACGAGRLPCNAIATSHTTASTPATQWLLDTASLELAAVVAFKELSSALESHGAPLSLIARARIAQRDEVRHASILLSLAAARGGHAYAEARFESTSVPSLAALAIHNAAEGCVREAFGALEAAHHAASSCDSGIRAAMTSIARDEARHALLSLDIDSWARAQVGVSVRREMDRARAATAVDQLERLEPHAI